MRHPRPAQLMPRGIRARLTVLTALVVAAPLLLGVLVLANLLQRSLNSSLSDAAHQQARDVAAIVQTSGVSGINAERQDVQEDFRVDVIDASGHLVYGSVSHLRTPFAPTRPEPGQTVVTGVDRYWLPGDVRAPLVVAMGVTHEGSDYVVQVASSQQSQHEAVSAAAKYLLLAVPILVALSAFATWWLVTMTLRPVERIRVRVDHITAARLSERVPVSSTNDEIATLARTMNAMLGRLQDGQDAQQRFVADASHELRSPLATLRAAVDLGNESGSDTSWQEMHPLVDAELTRLQHLVDGLLLLSKADDRGMRLRLVDIDLDDLAESEALRLETLGQHQITRQISPARISGDLGRLEHAVRNLGDNAVRHARTTVRLSVHPAGDGATLCVEDDGAGIPPDERSRVFDRFIRLDASRSRDSGGSGLGLAITREVVLAHGGTVAVTDSDLGGARFEIWVPTQPPVGESR